MPKSITLYEIKDAITKDPIMTKLCKSIYTGHWDKQDPELKPYIQSADQFTAIKSGDIILKGNRIVILELLQEKVTKLGHVGHHGEGKTKKLLREKVWYPRMDQKVKDMIDKCIACQDIGQSNPPEPMKLTPTDNISWNSVAIDFYGPIPNTTTQYLLVCMDLYSKFPDVEIMNSAEAKTVIPKLDVMWARHCIPTKLKSDNGPPMSGQDFKTYTEALRIKLKPSICHCGHERTQMPNVL